MLGIEFRDLAMLGKYSITTPSGWIFFLNPRIVFIL